MCKDGITPSVMTRVRKLPGVAFHGTVISTGSQASSVLWSERAASFDVVGVPDLEYCDADDEHDQWRVKETRWWWVRKVRTVLTVSKEDLLKAEAKWKQVKKRTKKAA